MASRTQPKVASLSMIEKLSIMSDRIRRHALISTHEAGSGHPTSAMSCAELITALFFHFLRTDLRHPKSLKNDRFILSKGHASPALWAVLAEAGLYTIDQLVARYRQFGTDLEGHPTPRNPWVDVATGSLGQGLSIGAGMALESRLDNIDNHIYVLLGDGELAEGAIWEAAAIAAHYKLQNLIAIVDVNRLGQTEATMHGHDMDAYARKFTAFGWQTTIIDGHDMNSVMEAYQQALEPQGAPFAILARTFKGRGVSFLEDENGRHGKPVTGAEYSRALEEIGSPELPEPLEVGKPEPADRTAGRPETYSVAPSPPTYESDDQIPTRRAYAVGLTKLGRINPNLVVLDAELKNSTYTETFHKQFPERFIECYIAEQNMVGMALGLSALGKIPFCSTFASFFTRAHDQIRMAAISEANVKYAGSHAGISIGEDGPSQMGLEDIALFRALPRSTVLYPADAVSTERLVRLAAEQGGTTYIRLTRGSTPILYSPEDEFTIGGSKTLKSSDGDKVAIFAAGITLHEALRAAEDLEQSGIAARVVDIYSIKPIDERTVREAAQKTGFVVTVEDHYPDGGLGDVILNVLAGDKLRIRKLAVNALPCSGAPATLMDHFGISSGNIVNAVRDGLAQM